MKYSRALSILAFVASTVLLERARAGTGASGGPIVANGMVFIGSGYPGFQIGQPGNVLLAFAPAVRLDVFADERKRKAEETK